MRNSRLRHIPGRLWRLVSLAGHRLLLVDDDGTLAPFRTDRQSAPPLTRSLALLRRIAHSPHTTVVVTSGRPVSEMRERLCMLGVTLVGENGWESLDPDGNLTRLPVPPAATETLARAALAAVQRGWNDLLELKRASLRLHTRGMAPMLAQAIEDECLAVWQDMPGDAPVRLERLDGGLELRARGRDKGRVALEQLEACPPGTMAVAIGDDEADECAFDALGEFGFGVRVGDPDAPSVAHGRLEGPSDVTEFLQTWLKATAPAQVRSEHPMLPGFAPEFGAAMS